MGNWQRNPALNYSYNMLQDNAQQLTSTGESTTGKGMQDLQPSIDSYKRLLSGDTTALLQEEQPQIDQVTSQFNQVRQMLASAPRGGGTASAAAELPVQQIQTITNLLGGAKQGAAAGLTSASGLEAQTGLSESSQGLQAGEAAAGIAQKGREDDIANSWSTFFKNLAGGAAKGAGSAAAMALMA